MMKSRTKSQFRKPLLPPELVFVYGTLKSTEHNNVYLQAAKATKLGNAITCTQYPLTGWRLPTLYKKPGSGHQILGELWRVPARGMYLLDSLEGHPNWYNRSVADVRCEGDLRHAWIYFLADHNIPPDWETRHCYSEFSSPALD